MDEEFNLSEKIIGEGHSQEKELWLFKTDVKEFIKKLKEEIDINNNHGWKCNECDSFIEMNGNSPEICENCNNNTFTEFIQFDKIKARIDKLAGDKLK